jgi:hypothetical protein
MKAKAFLVTLFSLCFALSTSAQQKTEVTISLNEQFFDSLIDAIYQNSPPPEFQLSSGQPQRTDQTSGNAFASKTSAACSSVTLLRENRSVRTASDFATARSTRRSHLQVITARRLSAVSTLADRPTRPLISNSTRRHKSCLGALRSTTSISTARPVLAAQ